MQPNNLAARAGRWSSQHRKKAIFGWLAFVIVALVLGSAVGTNEIKDEDSGSGESARADKAYADAFPKKTADESVFVQGREGQTANSPEFKAAVADVITRLERTEHVVDVADPYAHGGAGISRDGTSALVDFEIPGEDDVTKERVDAALDTTAAAQQANPGFRVEQFGDASVDKQVSKSFEDDFKQAEITSLPVTLVILVLAFGALMAAGIPLLLALTAVAATIGIIGPVSQLIPVEESINSVVLLIGLAVGVDYVMFYLRREREERAAGRSEEAALEAAAATSGHAVLVSGGTVMIAMAGMFIAGNATFTGFAIGTILVVAIAVVGSLTVLPALLSKLGDRVNKGRIPFVTPPEERVAQGSRIWNAVLDRVLNRPAISAAIAITVLVLLAVPALGMKTAIPGIDTMSRDMSTLRTYDRIQEKFPGDELPAEIVIKAHDVNSYEVKAAVADLEQRATESGLFADATPVTEVSEDRTVASISVALKGDGTSEASERGLDALRDDIIPATLAKVTDSADVTGFTAGTRDFNDLMADRLPLVFAFVLAMAFALLLVTFRSLTIPIVSIGMNLISVAAAYGLMTWIFVDGNLEGLLGFESTGAITSWLPLFMFVVLFGLSMDYHVFILSRIKEAFDRGASTADAVTDGIKSTATVVSAAAFVMVAVFGIFATLSSIDFKQMGVGLAAAVLIDATIIRGVLLPAVMKLMGDRSWYLPKSLRWLPRIAHEPEVEPARA